MTEDRIELLSGEVLTVAVFEHSETLVGITIKNRLLDGSLHIQSIGTPQKNINLNVAISPDKLQTFNTLPFTAERIRLVYDEFSNICIVDDIEGWAEAVEGEINDRIYVSKITLAVVEEEGSI
jgi:hypothetical protein